jgi:hypothetical protein
MSDILEEAEKRFAAKDIELARWQDIAMGAKAEAIYNLYWQGVITEYPTQSHQMPLYRDLEDKTEYKKEAAKELQLEATKEANYVARLEKAFIDLTMNCCFVVHAGGLCEEEIIEHKRKTAQAALAKIREWR